MAQLQGVKCLWKSSGWRHGGALGCGCLLTFLPPALPTPPSLLPRLSSSFLSPPPPLSAQSFSKLFNQKLKRAARPRSDVDHQVAVQKGCLFPPAEHKGTWSQNTHFLTICLCTHADLSDGVAFPGWLLVLLNKFKAALLTLCFSEDPIVSKSKTQ